MRAAAVLVLVCGALLGASGAGASAGSPLGDSAASGRGEAAGTSAKRRCTRKARRGRGRCAKRRRCTQRRRARRKRAAKAPKRRCARRKPAARTPGQQPGAPGRTGEENGRGSPLGGSGGPLGVSGPLGRYLSVAADEFRLALSRPALAAGAVTVELRNVGEDPHNLVISRDTGSRPVVAAFPDTPSGAVETRGLQLPAGGYYLYCSLAGHELLGMSARLQVR